MEPPSFNTSHLLISQRSITLFGLGSQLTALPLDEELELAAELAAELATELASDELDELMTMISELEDELTATELAAELSTTELAAELSAAELAAELTAAELADETTVTELELLDFFLSLLPPQAVIRALTVSTTANCFTIMVNLLLEKRQQTSERGFAVARVVIR